MITGKFHREGVIAMAGKRYTMLQACRETGMTYEALKYYCNEGLVPEVTRDGANRRVFEEYHIKWIKDLTCLKKCGLSIKPATPADALVPYLSSLDMVLVMSVEPGFGGQRFMPESLEKIRRIRELAPRMLVSVDGGINAETAQLVKHAGANCLVAGSFFFKAADKRAAVDALRG